jgi:hypothetical protein
MRRMPWHVDCTVRALMDFLETENRVLAENFAEVPTERTVGGKKPQSSARKPAVPRCNRCGSGRNEQMIRAAHIALYKCADCGWRYGYGNRP